MKYSKVIRLIGVYLGRKKSSAQTYPKYIIEREKRKTHFLKSGKSSLAAALSDSRGLKCSVRVLVEHSFWRSEWISNSFPLYCSLERVSWYPLNWAIIAQNGKEKSCYGQRTIALKLHGRMTSFKINFFMFLDS